MLYTINQQQVVLETAKQLKTVIKMPEWALFVKTGAHRETMPRNPDWWYIRAASILRLANVRGPVGVQKLRTRYGGRKNRGMKPDRFGLASGKVIRAILQQLEEAGLVKQAKAGVHKGRIATPAGKSLLVKAAKSVVVVVPKKTPKAAKPVKEEKKAPAKEEKVEEKPKAEATKEKKPEAPKEDK